MGVLALGGASTGGEEGMVGIGGIAKGGDSAAAEATAGAGVWWELGGWTRLEEAGNRGGSDGGAEANSGDGVGAD